MSDEITVSTEQFDEIIKIVDKARSRAMNAVNKELIQTYWKLGEYISNKVEDGGWGKRRC